MKNKRTEKLREIRDEVWNFTSSPLYEFRTKNKFYPVIGQGSHHAAVVIIGEAPGLNEAKTGHPFIGKSGNILDKLLKSISLDRKDIYITNIVKDRPPENRDPTTEEIAAYAPFLIRQLSIIKPRILVPLGRFSAQFILKQYELYDSSKTISKIHGKVFETITPSAHTGDKCGGQVAPYGPIRIIPQYHPAVAAYNPNMIKTLEADFQKIKNAISQA